MATVLSLQAHPDDESLLCAGWLAQRAAAGDRVVLAYATDGNAGDAADSFRSEGSLGQRRRAEATRAARALGVARVVWLGWDDSGMAHDPTSAPDRFVDAPVEVAAARVASLVREESVDLLTGYDARGGYGHPDHVQVHRVARAVRASTGVELWEATMDRTWLVRGIRLVRPLARLVPSITLPGEDIYSAPGPDLVRHDVRDQVPAKQAALRAHASQASGGLRTVGILAGLPGPLARRVLGTEWMLRVRTD